MKAEIKKTKEVQVFKPFKLVLTVETEVEAREIWHRFNLAGWSDKDAVLKYGFDGYVHECADISNLGEDDGDIIRNLITSQGVRP